MDEVLGPSHDLAPLGVLDVRDLLLVLYDTVCDAACDLPKPCALTSRPRFSALLRAAAKSQPLSAWDPGYRCILPDGTRYGVASYKHTSYV